MTKKEREQRDEAIQMVLIVLCENTKWVSDKVVNRVATMFDVSFSLVQKILDNTEI